MTKHPYFSHNPGESACTVWHKKQYQKKYDDLINVGTSYLCKKLNVPFEKSNLTKNQKICIARWEI